MNQARTNDGATSFYAAAEKGHTKVARLMIAEGAAVNQTIRIDWETPLSHATWEGHTDMVRLLIAGGAAVSQATTSAGATLLFVLRLRKATQRWRVS